MGSSYFYLEFLMAWHHLLVEGGFKNPAIFALEYTLVPDQVYPRQVLEALEGYNHVLEVVKDASKVCVSGDSAGGSLILSLLLELGAQAGNQDKIGVRADVQGGLADPDPPQLPLPRMATLISPWISPSLPISVRSRKELTSGSLFSSRCVRSSSSTRARSPAPETRASA